MLAGAGNHPQEGSAPQHATIVLAHEPPFRIGEAEFHPPTREVVFDGERSVVEPRVMQVLVALHRAGEAVVSKDDLARLCWDGRIVGEDAINRVVSRLRAVAEKQAGGQFRVETITKVGYRLVGGNGASGDKPAVTDRAAPGHKVARRNVLIGGAAIGTLAAAGVGWTVLRGDGMPHDARLLVDDARNSLAQGSVEQTGNALAKVRQAVQIAPNSAEAWGLLAVAYMKFANAAPSGQRPDLRVRGDFALRRAFALEPDQPDARTAEIWGMQLYRNWYACEIKARAALARHPDHALLNYTLAGVLIQVGRMAEAIPLYDKALTAFPLAPVLHVCRTVALWAVGRLDDADAAVTNAFELLPRHYGVWFTRLYYLMYNGQAAEARAMIADAVSRPIGIPEWNYELTAMQVNALASGDRAQVRRTIEVWKKAGERGTGFAENGAIFAAFADDVDESFRLLNGLYFNRGFRMPDLYFGKEQGMYSGVERHTYTLFGRPIAAIRRDPRFGVLTRELGLDDYWRRSNSRSLAIA